MKALCGKRFVNTGLPCRDWPAVSPGLPENSTASSTVTAQRSRWPAQALPALSIDSPLKLEEVEGLLEQAYCVRRSANRWWGLGLVAFAPLLATLEVNPLKPQDLGLEMGTFYVSGATFLLAAAVGAFFWRRAKAWDRLLAPVSVQEFHELPEASAAPRLKAYLDEVRNQGRELLRLELAAIQEWLRKEGAECTCSPAPMLAGNQDSAARQ